MDTHTVQYYPFPSLVAFCTCTLNSQLNRKCVFSWLFFPPNHTTHSYTYTHSLPRSKNLKHTVSSRIQNAVQYISCWTMCVPPHGNKWSGKRWSRKSSRSVSLPSSHGSVIKELLDVTHSCIPVNALHTQSTTYNYTRHTHSLYNGIVQTQSHLTKRDKGKRNIHLLDVYNFLSNHWGYC